MSIDALLQAAEFLERREREAEHGYASSLPMPDDLKSMAKRPKTKKSYGGSGYREKHHSISSSSGISTASSSSSSSSRGDRDHHHRHRRDSESYHRDSTSSGSFRRSLSPGDRTTHNELEKNRRAHLRNCLEKLKEIVPLGNDSARHTTLGLLTKAKSFIKTLERQERKNSSHKDQLRREQRYLGRRLEQLGGSYATALAMHGMQPTNVSKRRSVSECSTSTVSSTSSVSSSVSSISESDEVDVIGYTSTQSDTDDHSSVQSASSDSGVTMSTSRLTLSEMEMV
ncbi:max-interacting protein 1-like [Thrips palmi]|uniref:Max-interacting protein 1-like n=1 Tax=Thrips palmi TaxID=161013 RepID=A0A6P8YAM6_THRPL|nr:max-interacting protein 1-like [Thrips palmi]